MNGLTVLYRRATRDTGSILASVLVLLLALSGLSYVMLATTGRHIQSASLSQDLLMAGQSADYAVQDAMATLNDATASKTPRATVPTSGAKDMGDGNSWEWKRTGDKILASGHFKDTTRAVEATVGSINVKGYKVQDGSVTYILAMEEVFSHRISGSDVKVTAGYGISSGDLVKGDIGVLSGTAVVDRGPLSSAAFNGTARLYGAGTALTAADGKTRKTNVGAALDSDYATRNLATCNTLQAWKASDHGGQLNAGSLAAGNNAGCYSSMNFDVPTNIIGNGAFHAFVKGGVVISADITGAALNIFTDGDVKMDVAAAAGARLTVADTFIHAAKGTCTAAKHSTKRLEFTGSIACNKVDVSGRFNDPSEGPFIPGTDVAQAAGTAPERMVWTLDEYQQPSGFRE